eukprot:844798-Pyramimonas_sp.AAC.1
MLGHCERCPHLLSTWWIQYWGPLVVSVESAKASMLAHDGVVTLGHCERPPPSYFKIVVPSSYAPLEALVRSAMGSRSSLPTA